MEQISKRLKTQTTAMSLFLQSLLNIVIGIIMILGDELLLAKGIRLLLSYFAINLIINFIQILSHLKKDKKKIVQSVLKFFAAGIILFYLDKYIHTMMPIIPIAMCFWALLATFSNLISLVLYWKEEVSVRFRFVCAAVANMAFAGFFLTDNYRRLSTSINVIGIYLIVLGCSVFFDALTEAMPSRYQNATKYRSKITLPVFMTTFIPLALLKNINEFLEESMNENVELKSEKDTVEPNIEIFIHISNRLSRVVGHVDFAIGDKVICYGAYDKESIKFGGVLGTGILFEVYNKKDYIEFCKEFKNEVLFGFGLALTDEELNKLKIAVEELKSRVHVWKSNAQIALEENKEACHFEDYASKLYNTTDVTFYKFTKGAYKHFWIMGTNCVKFTDSLLKASGIKTVMAGIITPGTYFTFLNGEFMKENSMVVKREIYLNLKK
ncbi:MAG: hypothetical protein R3Y24_04890 [Eubacteriales bacterium]